MPQGLDEVRQMQEGGFSDTEIQNHIGETRATLVNEGGFTDRDVDNYFGIPQFDGKPLEDHFHSNLTDLVDSWKPPLNSSQEGAPIAAAPTETPAAADGTTTPPPKEAETFTQAFEAGFQMSASGLLARGKLPDIEVGDQADWYMRIAKAAGMAVSDIPENVVGAALASPVGLAGGPATPVTAIAAAGFGANALPTAMREILMSKYRNGEVTDFKDFWTRASGVFMRTVKDGVVGAATLGAGGAVGNALKPVLSPLLNTTAKMASEVATMVTFGKALEGQVPKPQDFSDAAIVVAALHGATHVVAGKPVPVVAESEVDTVRAMSVQDKLHDIYAKTGIKPSEVAEQATKDPVIRQQLIAKSPEIPEAYQNQIDKTATPTTETTKVDKSFDEGKFTFGGGPTPLDTTKDVMTKFIGEEGPSNYTPLDVSQSVEGKIFYHGTKADLANLSDADPTATSSVKNLYGNGLYLTDSQQVAEGYARTRGKGPEGKVFAAKLGNTKLIDLEQPLPATVLDVFNKYLGQYGGQRAGAKAKGTFVFDQLKESFQDAGLTQSDVVEIYQQLNAELSDAGYDGLRYEGGNKVKAGQGKHNVAVLFPDANNSVSSKFTEVGGPSRLDTTAQKLSKFLASEGGSAGTPPAKPEIVRTDAENTVLSRIGEVTKEKQGISWDATYTAAIDKFHPIGLWRDVVTQGEKVPIETDPYFVARLTRGNSGRATQFIENSPYDYNTLADVPGSKPLKEIFEPHAHDLDGWRAYAISKRAINLSERGIETGVDVEAAKKVVADGGAKYEKSLQEVVGYRRNLLNYMRDSGILKEEQIRTWEKTDPDYAAPFYRILEESPGGAKPGKALSVKVPIKAIKGSDALLVDPVESLIRDTYTFVELSERNRALRSVVELGEKYLVPPELLEKVQTPLKPIDVTPDELNRFQNEFGLGGEVAGQAMTIFRPLSRQLAPDEIAVYRDGQRQTFRVPQELADALKGMDAPAASTLMKIISGPVKTLKAGTVILPDFAAKNFMRDQLSAFSFSKNGYIPVVDFLQGMKEIVQKGDAYQEWLKGGGAAATFVSMDRDYISNHVMQLDTMDDFLSRTWNLVKTPKQVAQAAGELIENSTRVGEMRRAMEGKAPTRGNIYQGAFDSREVTVDFQRSGAKLSAFNAATAFQNPQIQGADRLARAFKDNPIGMTVKAGVIATISTLVWAANRNDPRLDDLPRWQRDLFWLFPTDKWRPASQQEASIAGPYARQNPNGGWEINEGPIFKIPKPQEMGVLFGSVVERGLDAAFKNDPRAFKELLSTIGGVLTPSILPTATVPFMETFNNKSTFTGAPIVPDHLMRLLPEAQYTEYTTETAKLLGKIIPPVPFGSLTLSSPMVVENWIRSWSGGLGTYAMQIVDEGLYRSNVVPRPPKADSTLADMPFVKAFVARFPTANAQSIVDFRERNAENQKYVNTLKYYAQKGDVAAANKLLTAQENQAKFVSLQNIETALNRMKTTIERISQVPGMNGTEKRQLQDGLYMGMIQAARLGNKTLDEIETQLKQK